jgi:DNA-binding HxlR family transcriptional regulator
MDRVDSAGATLAVMATVRTTAGAVEPGADLHPVCPRYHHAVELIGRRWTGAVVRLLTEREPQRFTEILAQVPGLSDRLLTERLRELENEGLVERTVITGPPVRVEYSLTTKGRELEPVVLAIAGWAEKWLPVPLEHTPDD